MEVDFLEVTINSERNTYRPYKKSNDNLTYINISSNHPLQIIKHLTQTISERLFRNSLSAEIFEQSKPDYEEALKYIYAVMKTMCPTGYHHNSFMAAHALGHMMYGYTLLVPMNQRVLNKLSKEHKCSL